MFKFLEPKDWKKPKGYANGIVTKGELIFLGGQIGWNQDQEFETDDFVGQFAQTLKNIVRLLAEAKAGPEHVVRLTWFITDREAYLSNQKGIGNAYREIMGRNFPTMSVVEVVRLMEERAKIEIEATAVLSEQLLN